MKNIEKIRNMSEEELMRIILCPYDRPGIEPKDIPCWGEPVEKVTQSYCDECMRKWLNSEAEC